jgi:hypothetical protein
METNISLSNRFNSMLLLDEDIYCSLSSNKNSLTSIEQKLSFGQNSIQNCLSKDLIQEITNDDNDNLNNDNKSNSTIASKHNVIDLNKQNKPKQKKTKKEKVKNFVEREDDWVCFYCQNLNFSFREYCNRCNAYKNDSEKEHDLYMENVLCIIKQNEEKRKQFQLRY